MSLLEIRPLTDMDALKALYSDPYISRVGHDDRPAAPLVHEAVSYHGAYVDSQFVGAFLLIESGFIEVDAHVLLKRSALRHSRRLAHLFLNQVFANLRIERVSAYVIDGLTAALNFVKKLGFKYEGYRRAVLRKDGILLGVHMLGMTRNDWKEIQ